jgi:hypothetical protein
MAAKCHEHFTTRSPSLSSRQNRPLIIRLLISQSERRLPKVPDSKIALIVF